ncbi:truB [Scenedesmus sp. PABB004]|nr:truB [Scenedesmus sp. PABB004]
MACTLWPAQLRRQAWPASAAPCAHHRAGSAGLAAPGASAGRRRRCGGAAAAAAQPPAAQQAQAQQQQQAAAWGYLSGAAAEAWTWDDDYSPAARARAAAEARAPPPSPRQQRLAAAAAAAAAQRPTVITRLPEHFSRQVLANAVLLVDKPARWSSADVVRQLKASLRADKVGHGGPLDAHATGLLIVLLGERATPRRAPRGGPPAAARERGPARRRRRESAAPPGPRARAGAATRLTPKLEPLERSYSGVITLGAATTTYDASGQLTAAAPWEHLSDAELAAAAARFEGEVLQVPCMWSSTKFKNRPLRWYAERGEEVAREPKAVTIRSIRVWREAPRAGGGLLPGGGGGGEPAAAEAGDGAGGDASGGAAAAARSAELHFRVVAGKGASMRVLAHDLGALLGCGAHLSALRREAVGGFSVESAWSLDVLLPLAKRFAKGFRNAAPQRGQP